jgi:hypothetical protein
MSAADERMGGPPGSLRRWLFGLRLPPNEHRILELHCEKADPEDGCHWRGERYIAHWSGMTERNVRRINAALANPRRKGGALLRIYDQSGRSNVYQVLCPDVPRLDDLSRVELMRGDKLGAPRDTPDKLSAHGTPDNLGDEPWPRCPPTTDIPGAEAGDTPDNLGDEPWPRCPPKLLQGSTPPKNEDPQEQTHSAAGAAVAPEPAGDAGKPYPDYGHYLRSWNERALQLGLSQVHTLNEPRRRALRTRVREPAFEWAAILERLGACIGGWMHSQGLLDFDFVTKNSRGYVRLLEGNYDARAAGQGPGGAPSGTPSGTRQALDTLQSLRRPLDA